MTIYLAGPWDERELAASIGAFLARQGYLFTEEWWLHPESTDPQELERQARLDEKAIAAADVFVLLNTQPRGQETTGKAVEFGYAWALGKTLIVVGPRTNIFHWLPEVHLVDDRFTLSRLLHELTTTFSGRSMEG